MTIQRSKEYQEVMTPDPEGEPEYMEELRNLFEHHVPKRGQGERYEAVRVAAMRFAMKVKELTPASEEQNIAILRIGEAMMQANAAIARNE